TKEVETGYNSLMVVSDVEAEMREDRIEKTKTVCTYCGVGCSFDVWTKGREILKIEPQEEAPANGVSTCVKGKFGWDFVNSDERLTKPLIRKGDSFVESTWEEALDIIESKFKDKMEENPDKLAFISSSKCTNEESYLMQKLARGVVGTNNVDNCSRYCQSPATMGLWRTVGHGGDSGSITDIRSEALDIIESKFKDKMEENPDKLAFISSSKCTNEESYLMQKLARGVVGTNNVDNCSRYCQSPATMGLWRTVGHGGDSGSITDI